MVQKDTDISLLHPCFTLKMW